MQILLWFIIDWGKFQYQKMKIRNRKKAREKQSKLKQMKIGLKISDNDLNIKSIKSKVFCGDGGSLAKLCHLPTFTFIRSLGQLYLTGS